MNASTSAGRQDPEDENQSASSSEEEIETEDQGGVTHMNGLVRFATAYLMKYGARNTEQMEQFITRCWSILKIPESKTCITAEFIEQVIAKVNAKTKCVSIEVKTTFDEFHGEQLFITTMTKENPMIMFQSKFKKQEIEMIQNIISSMLNKENDYTLTLSECVEEGSKVAPKLTHKDAIKVVLQLIDAFYLTKVPSDGDCRQDETSLTLGCRGIQEFSFIIQEKYPGVIASCKLCIQYLIHGYKCPACDVVVHGHCAQGYLGSTNKCLSGNKCNAVWGSLNDLDHRTVFKDPNNASTSTQPGTRSEPPQKKSKQNILVPKKKLRAVVSSDEETSSD